MNSGPLPCQGSDLPADLQAHSKEPGEGVVTTQRWTPRLLGSSSSRYAAHTLLKSAACVYKVFLPNTTAETAPPKLLSCTTFLVSVLKSCALLLPSSNPGVPFVWPVRASSEGNRDIYFLKIFPRLWCGFVGRRESNRTSEINSHPLVVAKFNSSSRWQFLMRIKTSLPGSSSRCRSLAASWRC